MKIVGAAKESTSGTIEEVASFFKVHPRTVQDWKSASPPVITHWQLGRNVTFGEEAVVELKVKRSVYSRPMKPGEAQEIARREWREHLKVCRADMLGAAVADLNRRILRLEEERKQAA